MTVEALKEIDRRRRDAMISGDVDALGTLLADDLVWTHSSGRQDGKASFLEKIAAGSTEYRSLEVAGDEVSRHGDILIHRGDLQGQVTVEGENRALRNRFLAVWRRSGEGFELFAWQSTKF